MRALIAIHSSIHQEGRQELLNEMPERSKMAATEAMQAAE
jgi:hypothetical protein